MEDRGGGRRGVVSLASQQRLAGKKDGGALRWETGPTRLMCVVKLLEMFFAADFVLACDVGCVSGIQWNNNVCYVVVICLLSLKGLCVWYGLNSIS